jgi:hypothetical protein
MDPEDIDISADDPPTDGPPIPTMELTTNDLRDISERFHIVLSTDE